MSVTAAIVTTAGVSAVVTAAVPSAVAGVWNWTTVIPATAVVTAIVGGTIIAAVVSTVIASINANVRIVRICGSDIWISIGRRITVARRVRHRWWCDIAADSHSETTNTDSDHHALGEQATTSQ